MKKYKLAGEDEHMFYVEHPDGSKFSIAKHAVGKEVHKRIKSLEPVKMAEGGEVPDEDFKDYSQLSVEQPEPLPVQQEPMNQNGLLIDSAPENRAPAASPQLQIDQLPDNYQPSNQQSIDQNNTSSKQLPTNVPDWQNNTSSLQNKILDEKKSAIEKNLSEQTGVFQNQANVWNKLAQDESKLDVEAQKRVAPTLAIQENLRNEILNGRYDHNRLYKNMSTGNKVLAAISIAISGLGSGLTGKPNMALGVLDKSIDRDLEEQKLEMGKKQNLFNDNLRLLGDERSATLASKSQLLAGAEAKVHAYAAQEKSAEAKLNAQIMLNGIKLEQQKNNQELAYRQMGMQGGNFDPSLLVSKLVPESKQAETFKEIKDAQNIRNGANEGLEAFKKAAEEQKLFSKNALPGVNSAYLGKLKASVLPQFQNIDGTVRQAAMDAFLPTITPAVGDSQHTQDVKFQTLKDWYIAHSSAPTAKGFGIDLDKFGSTTTQQPPDITKRFDPASGKTALFDSKTKKFLRYE